MMSTIRQQCKLSPCVPWQKQQFGVYLGWASGQARQDSNVQLSPISLCLFFVSLWKREMSSEVNYGRLTEWGQLSSATHHKHPIWPLKFWLVKISTNTLYRLHSLSYNVYTLRMSLCVCVFPLLCTHQLFLINRRAPHGAAHATK